MKNLTWQNPGQLFVAQELIKIVKLKCCGIKEKIISSIARESASDTYIDVLWREKWRKPRFVITLLVINLLVIMLLLINSSVKVFS